jgi:threonine synthase
MPGLRFKSSRGAGPFISLSEAIVQGLAADGGLFVPTQLPTVNADTIATAHLPQIARACLAGLFAGDRLLGALGEIAEAAFDIPAPTTAVAAARERLFALELYHGPTAAFKDFGARFLAQCLERLQPPDATSPLTILVATSGDTGGAVAAAFHRRPWARVVILYPKGLVSPRQEHQLSCWGDNVLSLRVAGTFDDCQALVKNAFRDPAMSRRHRFTSANSINIGRLMPQMAYYAASSLEVARRTQSKPSYIIPAGNLGNALAAVWARAMGFPIARIILAHNINRTVPDFLASGEWRPRPSIATLASAMDVGNPSNMERLRALYPGLDELREQVSADSVDDATIRTRIKEDFMQYGREWCPHTATAAEVYYRLSTADKQSSPWVVVATAHPAKFNEIVEPLIGRPIEVPLSLAQLLRMPQRCVDLAPTLDAFSDALE